MKQRYGLLLIGLALGGQMACTRPPETPTAPDSSEVPGVDPASLVPPLSTEALHQREAELQAQIQSEMDLAGLGKVTGLGEPIAPELEQFRQAWAAVDPAIAPFLGTWVRDWNLMPYDFMTVFPSTLPGQVCLVRYRQMETETVPIETITTPLEFSVAQVIEGQLLGFDTQSARSLIRRTPASAYVPYAIEFVGTVETTGELRLYASQKPPVVDPSWEPSLIQQLQTFRCQATLP